VRNVIVRLFAPHAEKPAQQAKDSKTTLQEILQKGSRATAVYKIIDESGPAHKKHFLAEVSHLGKVLGKGEGNSKKEAERAAATAALKKLG